MLFSLSFFPHVACWRFPPRSSQTLCCLTSMRLEFKDNGTAHEDLLFSSNGKVQKCDSYYFALDRNLAPEDESPEKVKTVLKRLLEQWLEYVDNSVSGDILYLPYDFSDEYIGCLRCEFADSFVSLTDGYLSVGGYSVFPSDVSDLVRTNSYFTVSGKNSLQIPKQDFIRELKENIELV